MIVNLSFLKAAALANFDVGGDSWWHRRHQSKCHFVDHHIFDDDWVSLSGALSVLGLVVSLVTAEAESGCGDGVAGSVGLLVLSLSLSHEP